MSITPSRPVRSNPYNNGKMIRDEEMFFGRGEALQHLYAVIYDQQCLSLVGQRRVGKSSLLFALCSHARQRQVGIDLESYLLTYIDIGERHPTTHEEFLAFIHEQLIVQNPRYFPEQQWPEECSASTFRHFLEELHTRGLRPILLLDEFERVAGASQFDEDFFFFLRALANAGKVSYITASQNTLDAISHTGLLGSPFFNIFETYWLGPLTQDEALALITLPARRMGITFSDKETLWLLQIAGRHPFYLQRACYFLFEARQQHADLDWKQIASQVYEQLLPHFHYTWKYLDEEQREVLAWETRRQDVHQRQLDLYSESALFRRFVFKEQNIELDDISEETITEALDNIEDTQFLGKSALSHLNSVYQYAQGSLHSSIERGLAVKRVLLTAIEDLRPGPQQKQTREDAQTRAYQILALRYKHSLLNEEIAARLSISTRHLIREHKKAIKILLNTLLLKEQQATTPLHYDDTP
jgi:hypothetical protein